MTTTLKLSDGDRIAVDPTLNSSGFTATVRRVEPLVLGAGPRAGKQATSGRNGRGDFLYRVVLVDVVTTTPPLQPGGMSEVSRLVDASPVRHHAVVADHDWKVL